MNPLLFSWYVVQERGILCLEQHLKHGVYDDTVVTVNLALSH